MYRLCKSITTKQKKRKYIKKKISKIVSDNIQSENFNDTDVMVNKSSNEDSNNAHEFFEKFF